MNRVGIDIGSTTVKIAIIDEQNKILFSAYERHYANIQETLRGIIERAYEQLGDQAIAPMITGSGGLTISEHLNIPFVPVSYTHLLLIVSNDSFVKPAKSIFCNSFKRSAMASSSVSVPAF